MPPWRDETAAAAENATKKLRNTNKIRLQKKTLPPNMRPFHRQILRSLPLHRPAYRAYSTWKTQTSPIAHSPAIFSVVLVVSGYVGWRLTSTQQNIALDAPQQRPSHPSTQISAQASAHVDEKEGVPQPRISTDTSEDVPETPSLPSSDTSPNPSGQGEELEDEESHGSAAFNPETGEINWDCPCLGGMAHGPCGLQFREAFSCFVFSEQEPKGIDCIEKFRLMQECFREHPEVYGEELIGDDESEEISDSPSPPSSADSPSSVETGSSEQSS